MPSCIEPGCPNDAVVKGRCHKHSSRVYRHGDANTVKSTAGQYTRGLSAEQRFWAKVDKNGPVPAHRPELGQCWVWTANKTVADDTGYGRFHVGKKAVLAHRYSYELAGKPIPEKMQLDHLCRNRICVRPTHLEPVTHRENCLRGEAPAARYAQRTECDRCGGELKYTTVHRGKRSGAVKRVVRIRYCPTCNKRRSSAALHAADHSSSSCKQAQASSSHFEHWPRAHALQMAASMPGASRSTSS